MRLVHFRQKQNVEQRSKGVTERHDDMSRNVNFRNAHTVFLADVLDAASPACKERMSVLVREEGGSAPSVDDPLADFGAAVAPLMAHVLSAAGPLPVTDTMAQKFSFAPPPLSTEAGQTKGAPWSLGDVQLMACCGGVCMKDLYVGSPEEYAGNVNPMDLHLLTLLYIHGLDESAAAHLTELERTLAGDVMAATAAAAKPPPPLGGEAADSREEARRLLLELIRVKSRSQITEFLEMAKSWLEGTKLRAVLEEMDVDLAPVVSLIQKTCSHLSSRMTKDDVDADCTLVGKKVFANDAIKGILENLGIGKAGNFRDIFTKLLQQLGTMNFFGKKKRSPTADDQGGFGTAKRAAPPPRNETHARVLKKLRERQRQAAAANNAAAGKKEGTKKVA
jgi:hypothetical protein